MIALDSLVRDVCVKLGDREAKRYFDVLREAVNAYRDLELYTIPTLKTVKLKPYQGKISLPNDFSYLNKVGVEVGGRIVVIHADDNIVEPDCKDYKECLETIKGKEFGQPVTFYGYARGANVGELFGYGGRLTKWGLYRFDKKSNALFFSSGYEPEEVVIEYKADSTINGLSYVPVEAVLAIENYILAELHTDGRERQIRRDRYEIEFQKVKSVYSTMTVDDWINVFNSMTKTMRT